MILTGNAGIGKSKVPTNKADLIKSIINIQKNPEENKNMNAILKEEVEVEEVKEVKPEDKGTINDLQAIASQILDKNLIKKDEVKKPVESNKSIDLDQINLNQSEFQSVDSDALEDGYTKAEYVFNNDGWVYKGKMKEGQLKEDSEGELKNANEERYTVKLSLMKGSKMGVFNDFLRQKVFFVNFETKTVTPT